MEGATLISTISLVDMKVESFPPYIYVPTHWVKAHQNYHGGAPSLGNLSYSKLEFSPFLSWAAARSSLHPSPKFCIYSLRSGELPTKVRRAFPTTSDISDVGSGTYLLPLHATDLHYIDMYRRCQADSSTTMSKRHTRYVSTNHYPTRYVR
jgi:hypothetical protein